MMGVTTRLVYVESIGDGESGESFAWYDGKALAAAQHREREQIHRDLLDIVKRADFDETWEQVRVARSGDRLLVEAEVSPVTEPTRRLKATIVVSVDRSDAGWADEQAREIAAILRDEELDIDTDRLACAFADGWSRMPALTSRRVTQALVAAGAALSIALWWLLNAGRTRRRRQAKAPTRSRRARAPSPGEQR